MEKTSKGNTCLNWKQRLLVRLQEEKEMKLKGGLYQQTQIKFAYNSNRIEGSRLSEDLTRYISKRILSKWNRSNGLIFLSEHRTIWSGDGL